MSWRQNAVEKASTQQSGPSDSQLSSCSWREFWIEEHVPERLGPQFSSPGERERNVVMANRVGVNMLQFCLVSNSLSHTTLSIKWEVYFSKELCRSSLLCRYDSACICRCICIMWLYNKWLAVCYYEWVWFAQGGLYLWHCTEISE